MHTYLTWPRWGLDGSSLSLNQLGQMIYWRRRGQTVSGGRNTGGMLAMPSHDGGLMLSLDGFAILKFSHRAA